MSKCNSDISIDATVVRKKKKQLSQYVWCVGAKYVLLERGVRSMARVKKKKIVLPTSNTKYDWLALSHNTDKISLNFRKTK